jgi:hypothetical protein
MLRRWPRLKKFVIRYSDFEEMIKGGTVASDLIPLSFSSIATLVQHCPLLRTLSLSIKMRNDIIIHDQIRYEGAFRLEELDVGYSLVTNEEDLALLLRDVCPAPRIKWNNMVKLSALKARLSALQLLVQTRRAEELARQTTELRRRVELLVKGREESQTRRNTSDIQIQTFQRQIEAPRAENEALRAGADTSADTKP